MWSRAHVSASLPPPPPSLLLTAGIPRSLGSHSALPTKHSASTQDSPPSRRVGLPPAKHNFQRLPGQLTCPPDYAGTRKSAPVSMRACAHTHTHTHAHASVHAHTHAHTHVRNHVLAYTRTCVLTHIHMFTQRIKDNQSFREIRVLITVIPPS